MRTALFWAKYGGKPIVQYMNRLKRIAESGR